MPREVMGGDHIRRWWSRPGCGPQMQGPAQTWWVPCPAAASQVSAQRGLTMTLMTSCPGPPWPGRHQTSSRFPPPPALHLCSCIFKLREIPHFILFFSYKPSSLSTQILPQPPRKPPNQFVLRPRPAIRNLCVALVRSTHSTSRALPFPQQQRFPNSRISNRPHHRAYSNPSLKNLNRRSNPRSPHTQKPHKDTPQHRQHPWRPP
jgi:hypothetical protein